MLTQPKKTKFRYNHILKYTDKKVKGNSKVDFGEYGLQAKEGGYISNKVIEAGRKVISPFIKKSGKIWIRIFPQLGKTMKPLEVRMGSGKGSVEKWVAVVKAGTVMFEIEGLTKIASYEVLKRASYKFPIKCKVIERKPDNN